MDTLLEILHTLNINHTLWIQLGCFFVSYLALSNLVFKPYYRAHLKRKESTVGGEEKAERLIKEAEDVMARYEARAKDVNSKYKEIFDESKAKAAKEYGQKLALAREEASKISDQVRGKVAEQVEMARAEIKKEMPEVSLAVASKLIGKELTL